METIPSGREIAVPLNGWALDEGEDPNSFIVNMGPQHPSTHGVFHMIVRLEGETVRELKPVMGYLHRNHEQIAEEIPWISVIPFTDRLDYICAMTNNLGYAMAVEKLAGIEVPEYAWYIRVIMSELTRLVNHGLLIGFLLNDLGAWMTPVLYAFREREWIVDLFEEVSGARMMCSYMRFGGVRYDLPPGALEKTQKIVDRFPRFLDEFEKLLAENEILVHRCTDVGVLTKDQALGSSAAGPVLRASGVNYDVRKVDKYGIYDRFDFKVPLGERGDTYDRYYLRMLEMRESVKILKQALKQIKDVQPKTHIAKVKTRGFKPPKGDAYARIEGPKGEIGFYIVSDGGLKPYRYHVRPPSFINLTMLEDMCVGQKVADAVIILGSIDIVLGEVDR
jgi:NADH-quinone oxidoreductase subunit D